MKPSPPKELPVAKNSKSSKKNTVAKNKTATKAKKTAKKVTKAKTKSTKKVVKKAGKKVAKKTARKVAKKTTKKVAKKTAKKVAKKTAKKVAKKTAKKVVKKAALPAKKTSQKVVTKAKPAPAKAEAKKTPAAKKTAPAAAPAVEAARTEATDLPQVGEHAPEFVLSTDDGTTVSLRDYLGKKNVVLYFYPKDDTPGCTKEACTFQEHMDHFTATDTVIVGVSPDDTVSHGKFRKKYNLGFPLGADVDNSVATSYGVWGEKSMYGRTYMGVTRATFLINKHGKIAAVWPKVKVDGHSEEVQAAITGLST